MYMQNEALARRASALKLEDELKSLGVIVDPVTGKVSINALADEPNG